MADANVLVATGVASKTDAPVSLSAFVVAEFAKRRRRCIHHPRIFNEHLEVPRIRLPGVAALRRLVCDSDCFFTADFTSFYYQFDISAVSKYFVFEDADGQRYRLLRLPMGLSVSCSIAQFVSRILSLRASEAAGTLSAAYIDNVLFGGTASAIARVRTEFLRLAKEVGLTVGDMSGPATSVEFTGLVLDAHAKTIALSTRGLDKIRELDFKGVTTRRQALHLFGVLFSASRIHPEYFAEFFFGVRFYRRMCSDIQHGRSIDEPFTVWPALYPSFTRTCQRLLENVPVPVMTQGDILVLATDASSVGFGYSVHGDSEARGGGRWLAADADRHINEKELLAVVFALKALSPPMSHKLVILVDSTVAFHALRKGYSASPGVNQVCAEIWGLIPKTTALDLRWIPSVANPADPPSRGSFQWDSINAKWIELYAEYPMVFGHELSHLR